MSEPDREPGVGSPLGRFDASDLDTIHEATMHILEEIGVQVKHDTATALLRDHGASVGDDDVVTLPRDLVETCLDHAPDSFTWHARNPDNSVTVGRGGDVVRAPGYGPSTVRTLEDGRRPATLADYETLVKLAQTTDVVTSAGYNLCEPTDVPQASKRVELLKRSLALSDKPVMGSTRGADAARESLELAAIAMDDPDLTRPVVAGLINTVPPRGIDESTLGALLTYAEAGQPLVVSSFTMAGASGPSGLAASMAQVNAENLVGITLAQLVNPGTPVVYGVPSSNIDSEHGTLTIGSAESALFVSFAGHMARYYGLPSRAGGGLTDGKLVDFQSGAESMFLQFATAASDVDFVLNAVGVLEAYSAVSPEKFVLDCETLRLLDRYRDGVTVDPDGFPFELMTERGPAGHFLDEPGVDEAGTENTGILDKRAVAAWQDDGSRTTVEAASDRVTALLDEYERPPLDPRVERRLEAYAVDATP